MGAIGGLLGLSGGAAGTGFASPEQAAIDTQQGMPLGMAAGESYYRNQAALQSQQNLLAALQGQGGLQKQGDVYGQFQDIAAGRGPNPAQAMLNQATGANVSNQAALMAGQRGSNANVGLMARQIAQQGANTQQQAVGQGAVMQANQSLAGLDKAAGVANTMAANQMAGTNAATSAEQAQYGNLLNALAAQNQARISSQGNVNTGNVALANTQMQGQQALIGGGINAAGAAFGKPAAHGGMIDGYASGGSVGPSSSFGQFLTTVSAPAVASAEQPQFNSSNEGAQALQKGVSGLGRKAPPAPAEPLNYGSRMEAPMMQSSGGMVDVVLSPGEKVVPPEKVSQAAGGDVEAKTVPGKAKVSGDSTKNDTYKTKLPEGSIVVPRTKSKDNKDAAAFVRAVLAKRGKK